MTRKPWTTPEHRKLAEAIEKGLSATDIADDFQRSIHSLYQKAKELGLKFHGHKSHNRKLSEADKYMIRALYAKGLSRDDLQKRYPVSRNYLNCIIRGAR